ncbi:carbonyl reductase [NADPH] 1-like [Panthera tigris]|uniref:carbonyl reductase [NADPH] 1-like n=1 Tax=Panthera tigris TaxID=9694 RepID=UPI001C6F5FDA|nr:carbonyl reductase [NADPH] 1-like [Panthera tigris]
MCSVHGTGLRKRVWLQHLLPGIYLQNLLLPITLTGRVATVSSIMSFIVLNNCSSELQQKFRSETITEEELVGLMNKFPEDTKSGVHRKEGCPDMKVLTYGVSKMGITVLSRIHARKLSEQRRGNRILLNACCPRWVRTDMGRPTAIKSPEEGAETPIYLALLPSDAKGPDGEFVMEKNIEQWGLPPAPVPSMGPIMILP